MRRQDIDTDKSENKNENMLIRFIKWIEQGRIKSAESGCSS